MFKRVCVPLLLMIACACSARVHRVESRDAVDDAVYHATPPIAKPTDARGIPRAIQRLIAADSSVTWEARSVLVGDVDCDGVADSAFVGRSPSRVDVGLIRARTLAPEVLAFGVPGGAVQDEIGPDRARLTFETLDYDPSGAVGAIEGFQRSKVCKGLNLDDGDSDSIHLFWNGKSHHLAWWRA